MQVAEKLNVVFQAEGFIESIKHLDNFDDIYSAVVEKDATVTRDELQEYLELVSTNMHQGDELSVEDLSDITGGGLLGVAAGIYGVSKAFESLYKIGEGIGKFIYNITHR